MATDLQQALQAENRKLKEKATQLVTIEKTQKALIEAGGRFFTSSEVGFMPVGELITVCDRNNIAITITYEGKR